MCALTVPSLRLAGRQKQPSGEQERGPVLQAAGGRKCAGHSSIHCAVLQLGYHRLFSSLVRGSVLGSACASCTLNSWTSPHFDEVATGRTVIGLICPCTFGIRSKQRWTLLDASFGYHDVYTLDHCLKCELICVKYCPPGLKRRAEQIDHVVLQGCAQSQNYTGATDFDAHPPLTGDWRFSSAESL